MCVCVFFLYFLYLMEILKNTSRNIFLYKYKIIKTNNLFENKIYNIFNEQNFEGYIEDIEDINFLNDIIKIYNNLKFSKNICIKDAILFFNNEENLIFCFKLCNFYPYIYSNNKVELYLIKNYNEKITNYKYIDDILINISS
mgnify:CR=1 FL=1